MNGISGIERLLNSKDKLEDTMSRQENIIILPYNTLRFMDAPIQAEINIANNSQMSNSFEEFIYKLVCRKRKSLADINGVDEEILEALIKANYAEYYRLAPTTEFYSLLSILKHQKFVKKLTALFPDYAGVEEDPDFADTDYYDGTIEGLSNYLNTHRWTCIVLGDVEIFDLLTRGQVDFNNKTVLISRLGYNYFLDKNDMLNLRMYQEIRERYLMDIATVNLFKFSNEALGGTKA